MNSTEANPSGPAAAAADHRAALAAYTTVLALDRTALAWIRTTLTMASFGFGLVTFFRAMRQANASPEVVRMHEAAIHFGTALIVLGIVATILSCASHLATIRRLNRGEAPTVTHWPLSVTIALLTSLAGLVGLWALFDR